MPTPTKHLRLSTCPLCEASCGIRVSVEDDVITSIVGDEDDVLSGGHICPKATALKAIHEDPDRLRHPLKRIGEHWHPVSWDEALGEAATRIVELQETYGNDAFGIYFGNPNAHNTGSLLFTPPLMKTLWTKSRFSATSVDQLPHMFANLKMLGHQLLFPIPDVDRCDYFVILGANPMASNGSIMTAPDMRRRLRAIRERGSVVVIDPRRTETARTATAHDFIRPGSDAWLLLGMAHEVFARGPRLGRLAPYLKHLDELEAAAAMVPPARAARHTGIAPERIRELARGLLEHERACLYGRMGSCTQRFGGLTAWLLNALNLLTGNFDRPGGMMFPTPAIEVRKEIAGMGLGRGHVGKWRSRVRGLPEFGAELPASCMAEEMLTPGEGQIRGMLTIAGNPVLSTPNGRKLDQALAGLEFFVAIDMMRNETTRHAHLLLPPVSPLQRLHYDLVFHALAVRNTTKLAEPVFEAAAGERQDWQIVGELRARIERQRHGPLHPRTMAAWAMLRAGPEPLLDAGLRLGPYGKGIMGWRPQGGPPGTLSLAALRKAPHGIDLGPLMPSLPELLPEPRIDMAPEAMRADLARLWASEDEETGSLSLIGRRHVRSNNSWMHNVPQLRKGRPRCTLMMHPGDAARRSVGAGETVRLRSRVGSVEVPVELSEDVMPGVVSLPHGFGHGRGGTRQRVADAHPGVSMNDVTDETLLDALTGTAVVNGVPVEVERLAQET